MSDKIKPSPLNPRGEPDNEPGEEQKIAALRRIVPILERLNVNEDFQWFLSEQINPRVLSALRDSLNLAATAEERTHSLHRYTVLKALLDYPGQQLAAGRKILDEHDDRAEERRHRPEPDRRHSPG